MIITVLTTDWIKFKKKIKIFYKIYYRTLLNFLLHLDIATARKNRHCYSHVFYKTQKKTSVIKRQSNQKYINNIRDIVEITNRLHFQIRGYEVIQKKKKILKFQKIKKSAGLKIYYWYP